MGGGGRARRGGAGAWLGRRRRCRLGRREGQRLRLRLGLSFGLGLRRRGGRDQSDAGLLGGLTHVPAVVWVGVLLLVCVALLVVGGAWLLAAWPA